MHIACAKISNHQIGKPSRLTVLPIKVAETDKYTYQIVAKKQWQ